MAETSGPRVTGTDAERQFDDLMWRDMFGDEAGVVGDYDGSSYALSLSSSTNVATLGSSSQASICLIGGFRHRINAGETHDVTMAAMGGSARTDIIAAQLNLTAFTGAPGPIKLVAITGTSTSLPTYDDSPPGIETLPLWSITRNPGQTLAQGTVKRLFPRLARTIDVPPSVALPSNVPLGYEAVYGDQRWRRELNSSGVPTWDRTNPDTGWLGISITGNGWGGGASYRVKNGLLHLNIFATRASWNGFQLLGTLPDGAKPSTSFVFHCGVDYGAIMYEVRVNTDGTIIINRAGTKGVFGTSPGYPV